MDGEKRRQGIHVETKETRATKEIRGQSGSDILASRQTSGRGWGEAEKELSADKG